MRGIPPFALGAVRLDGVARCAACSIVNYFHSGHAYDPILADGTCDPIFVCRQCGSTTDLGLDDVDERRSDHREAISAGCTCVHCRDAAQTTATP